MHSAIGNACRLLERLPDFQYLITNRSALKDRTIFAQTNEMPRPQRTITSEFPYHICARANNQDWFSSPPPEVNRIFKDVLDEAVEKFELKIFSFVLMSNHFHMIVLTPKANISEAMHYIMGKVSRRIARATGRINRIFGRRYHHTIISTSVQFALTMKYIARNPVRAGICKRVEEHPYSYPPHPVSFLTSTQDSGGFDEFVPSSKADFLAWTNQGDKKIESSIRAGLRKSNFELSRDLSTGKPLNIYDFMHSRKVPGT